MTYYVWLKAMHVAVALTFVGGLFAQTLGVAAGARGEAETVRLISRWDQQVTMPAMLMVWLSGAIVASTGSWFSNHWLWAKLLVVVLLSGIHGVQSGHLRRLRRGDAIETNASPFSVAGVIVILLAVLAVLAVAKPF